MSTSLSTIQTINLAWVNILFDLLRSLVSARPQWFALCLETITHQVRHTLEQPGLDTVHQTGHAGGPGSEGLVNVHGEVVGEQERHHTVLRGVDWVTVRVDQQLRHWSLLLPPLPFAHDSNIPLILANDNYLVLDIVESSNIISRGNTWSQTWSW